MNDRNTMLEGVRAKVAWLVGSLSTVRTKSAPRMRVLGSAVHRGGQEPADVDIAIVTETSEETQRLHVALIGLLPSAKIERLANYSSSSRHPANSLPYHYVITSDEELATKPAWRRSIEMGLDLLTGQQRAAHLQLARGRTS